ncbi:MAG: FAD/FMN-containing dehydrogenase/Fe-S oxidoreductase [Verrucomicrobiales bacterium]|jgi:FAD/FMN-containing dehydrogenase/Fe-S oxidoreductase
MASVISERLVELAAQLDGELHLDSLHRIVYSTDASSYQELPLGVAIPRTDIDLVELIKFAGEHRIGLIPRTAGTSLAGQVVGDGIVVDVSKHFTEILEINAAENWVRVQPGVIRNELNRALKPHGILFGPETSTQNRAMMGGMLGNNSCGSNSIKYGSVRDHVLEVSALLADGTKAVFGPLDADGFAAKCAGSKSLETQIYQAIRDALGSAEARDEITREFPDPAIPRRNTGYAIDLLMDASCFDEASSRPFHFGKLIAGSEGTLCFITEIKLHCNPLPPPVVGLQCAQFESVAQALLATQIAVSFDCFACELIDRYILDCTKRSLEHRENRFFLEGSPGAVLVIEIRGQSKDEVIVVTDRIEAEMRAAGLGYAFPVLFGDDTEKIWNLRKAGLGLMSNQLGDDKPVPVVEDTAVAVADLPEYIGEFNRLLKERFGLECVHYAHAGSGEIHLRPILNLKTTAGNRQFREVAQMIAGLVKRYRGSLSGEHGDGRLRGEFLKDMIGEKNYALVEGVKRAWDPQNIFNPGKIVDTPPMNEHLRYEPDATPREISTVFDWSSTGGILPAAEMCNGSGDCRKIQLAGGTMCPSYMATRDEKDTTRARANTLRDVLTNSGKSNPFDNEDLKDVLDLCLSCKGCKKECPSSVDMAKMKAEFQQAYYDANGIPLRSRLIANFTKLQRLASIVPSAWNLVFAWNPSRSLLNRLSGFHPKRSIPLLPKTTLARWFRRHKPHANAGSVGKLWLFNDEFTNFNDTSAGIAAVEVLEQLGYEISIPDHLESGRTWLSKGFIRKAKEIISENLRRLAPIVTEDRPLVGIEPSAILTFRDEAIELAEPDRLESARQMAPHCYTFEEFIAREASAGRITPAAFTDEPRKVYLHGHCFQKALSKTEYSVATLGLPANYQVEVIPSGCCGMAGSFGYEREHFDVSMKIAEMVVLPAVRQAGEGELIAAAGTSCRHQIHDGAAREALHPAEILRHALRRD